MDPEQRRFVCEHCGRRFKGKRFLKRHYSVHSDARQFFCRVCNKSYKYKKGLNRHESQAHGISHSLAASERVPVTNAFFPINQYSGPLAPPSFQWGAPEQRLALFASLKGTQKSGDELQGPEESLGLGARGLDYYTDFFNTVAGFARACYESLGRQPEGSTRDGEEQEKTVIKGGRERLKGGVNEEKGREMKEGGREKEGGKMRKEGEEEFLGIVRPIPVRSGQAKGARNGNCEGLINEVKLEYSCLDSFETTVRTQTCFRTNK
jgi:hypothetical protein